MKIISVSSHGIGAWLIKIFTFSKWNHTAIYYEDTGLVYDSTISTGVRKLPIDTYLKLYPNHDIVDIEVPDVEAAKAFSEKQVGKKYDTSAIFGLALQRDWQEDDKWFCAEVAEATIATGGRQRFRNEVSRITPHQCWAVK